MLSEDHLPTIPIPQSVQHSGLKRGKNKLKKINLKKPQYVNCNIVSRCLKSMFTCTRILQKTAGLHNFMELNYIFLRLCLILYKKVIFIFFVCVDSVDAHLLKKQQFFFLSMYEN